MQMSKEKILDAAEHVILRDGVSHLTIDAVAAEARLSKGGVLYHFPSKDDLIRGMILRLMEEFDTEVRKRIEGDPEPRGRVVRAHMNATISEGPNAVCERCDQLSAALLAAVATNPSLLKPLNESRNRMIAAHLNDGLDPATAMIIMLAVDGMWLPGLFGLDPLEPELRRTVIRRLHEMTRSV